MKHKDIHIIGDSCAAGPMVKSGYSTNSQAKACAINVVALMNGDETVEFSGINVCYADIRENESVTLALVYKSDKGTITTVPGSGGISPADFSNARQEHIYGESWLKNIMTEMST
jgi:sulfide dehydrogenase [flavocytochrome c] flavoprotein subunit